MESVASALAAGMASSGSSRGTIADRAGLLIAKAALCTATRPYSRFTDSSSNHACAAMPATTTHSTSEDRSDTLRRS